MKRDITNDKPKVLGYRRPCRSPRSRPTKTVSGNEAFLFLKSETTAIQQHNFTSVYLPLHSDTLCPPLHSPPLAKRQQPHLPPKTAFQNGRFRSHVALFRTCSKIVPYTTKYLGYEREASDFFLLFLSICGKESHQKKFTTAVHFFPHSRRVWFISSQLNLYIIISYSVCITCVYISHCIK